MRLALYLDLELIPALGVVVADGLQLCNDAAGLGCTGLMQADLVDVGRHVLAAVCMAASLQAGFFFLI